MIIQPKMRGFICTTAHPTGCEEMVKEQIGYVQQKGEFQGAKNALIIGGSTGYGLASRIVAAFGSGANTIAVSFERPGSDKRTATAGWYNTAAFERLAREQGLIAESVIGDAFSNEIKQQTIEKIKQHGQKIDLIVYSLASPKRTHPVTGETYSSVIKPIGQSYTNKTVDFHQGIVSDITVEPADEEEIEHTVAVMGGEDWSMWIDALLDADVLAPGVKTVAYSYIGPELTYPIYREGTIGKAKDDLEATAKRLHDRLSSNLEGQAYVSINKALVTQSSAAIPVVPLYISLLFKAMKDLNIHEGCIEQMDRLFRDRLYGSDSVETDENGRIRLDELEMRADVQRIVSERWQQINSDNIDDLADLSGYRADFYKLFGFGIDSVDYDREVDPQVEIKL